MKTGRMIGVLVLVGVAIGAALTALLPDFGFGFGPGGQAANPAGLQSGQQAASSDSDAPSEQPVAASGEPVESTTPAEEVQVPPSAVVFVLIDGRNFLLRRGPEGKAPYKPATLDEVVAAAQTTTGDDNGIRVRIAQKSSSRETTERALRAKLDEAGISRDSVRWPDQPLEGEATQ